MKLHLGCGKRFIEGYVHVDVAAFPHVEHVRDVRDLSFLGTGSVSEIYFCHGLEYFDRFEVVNILSNWSNTLAPGGLLRLAVPNFASIVELYQRSGDIDGRGILGPLFGRWEDGNGGFMYHRTSYDERSLTKLLEENGFTNVCPWDPFGALPPDYDDHSKAYVPHMDFENGVSISLNLCGNKK